jgi:hypothetical protein
VAVKEKYHIQLTMNKKNYGLLFILTVSLLLSLQFIPAFNTLLGDKEVYRYVGRVMLKGGVPYRDVFDHKPPLIFFLNYLALLLGGDWAQWLIDTCLVLLATCLFYQLGRKYRLPIPWLLPLLFNLMIRDFLMCLGMGMTREYTSILLLIFFCVFLGKSRYRHFQLGLLSGLIFFMQQDQVLALVPFFIYALLPNEDTIPVAGRVLRTAAGFGIIMIPVVGYFVVHGALKDFWQDAFLFNFGWYTRTLRESFGDHLRKLKSTLDGGNYELPFMVAMTVGTCALIFQSKKKGFLLVTLAAVVLSIIPEFMGGRDVVPNISGMTFTHYFLPLSASLSMLLFSVFAFTEEPVFREWKTQCIYGVLLCASLSYTALQHLGHLTRSRDEFETFLPEIGYLRSHRPGDHQLFVFGDTNATYAYNEFGIIGPSKWVYQHFYNLYDHWDPDHAILKSIQQELIQSRTTYILDWSNTPMYFRDPAAFSLWQSFLKEYYQPVVVPAAKEIHLWKWKVLLPQPS